MNPLNRWFKRPEEKRPVEVIVIENPVQVAILVYKVWLPIANESGFKVDEYGSYDVALADILYQRASSLLKPRAKFFKNVKPEDLKAVLSAIKPKDSDASGLFLSALLNVTELKELDGVFEHKILGYRLAEGKRLIVRGGSKVKDLAMYARGEVFNFGNAEKMARHASGGFQGNWGKVSRMAQDASGGFQGNWGEVWDIAQFASGGFQGNWGDVTWGMAPYACGGFQGNWGDVERDMAWCASGGFQGNWGDVKWGMVPYARGGFQGNWGNAGVMAARASGGVQGNWGKVRTMAVDASGGFQGNWGKVKNMAFGALGGFQGNWGKAVNDHCKHKPKEPAIKPYLQTLESKLKEIEFLKELKNASPEQAVEGIKAYDFGAFAGDVLELAKKIERLLNEPT